MGKLMMRPESRANRFFGAKGVASRRGSRTSKPKPSSVALDPFGAMLAALARLRYGRRP
jgi:hypothetical protein